MPWDASAPNLGFSTGLPWLPLGSAHKALSVSEQETSPDSTLHYARQVVAIRQHSNALRLGDITIIESQQPILAFLRAFEKERVICIFNMSSDEAVFCHDSLAASQSLGIERGSVEVNGKQLSLGPFAAHLARL
jgi:alpha-glucosidase